MYQLIVCLVFTDRVTSYLRVGNNALLVHQVTLQLVSRNIGNTILARLKQRLTATDRPRIKEGSSQSTKEMSGTSCHQVSEYPLTKCPDST